MIGNYLKEVLTLQAGIESLIDSMLVKVVEPSSNQAEALMAADMLFELCMVSLIVPPRLSNSDIETQTELSFYYSTYKKNPLYKL